MTEIIPTVAQHRALQSVRNKNCFRRYTANGNTVHSKDGAAPAVLWKLEKIGWIRETEHLTTTTSLFSLTDAGRMALRRAEEQ